MKTIEIALTSDGIKKAIRQIRAYKKSLETKKNKFLRELGNLGYDLMIEEIYSHDMPYSRGYLARSILVRIGDNTVRISNDSDHAVYVEFGTGIVGARNPYENNTIGYKYDIKGHGDKGWYYYDEHDGQLHWTKGMPSRPFVHDTYLKLREQVFNIAKEVFESDK